MAWYNDIGWWTGDTQRREAAEAQNQQALQAAGMQQGAAENVAATMEGGFAAQEPWLQRALAQLQAEYAARQGSIGSGLAASLGFIDRGEAGMRQAAQAQDAQRLGLIREGMGMDRSTLSSFLAQALGAQAPYAGAYQQMVGAALPQVLGAMQGTARMPLSSLARLQQEDTARSERAAMQRQGLEGSGMAAARSADANRRIAAQDEQRQMDRWMSMLTQGLGGANLTSGTLATYANAIGALGSRLGAFNPYDVASQVGTMGRERAQLQDRATQMSQSAKSGLPEAYGNLAQFYYSKMVNPATVRAGGTNAMAAAIGNQVVPQSTSGLGLIGDALKLYTGVSGAFGGGSGGTVSNPGWYKNMPMSAEAWG